VLPGRRYTPADIWHLLLRYKWLIVLPWIAVSAAVIIFGRTLPDRYKSESLIQVVPQRVPANLVRSTITADLSERLPVITAKILSRTRLERIIQEFRLYERERQTALMEDVVRDMANDIQIPLAKGDSFKVVYQSNDPRTAMRVTEKLASLFLEENSRDREQLAEGATAFLDSQLDDARRSLVEHETKLEEYRRQFRGELPSQLSANLQTISTLQNQISQNQNLIVSDRDRRTSLERQIGDLEAESISAQQAPVVIPEGNPANQPAAVRLLKARADLAQMELRFKPEHPDIIGAKRFIRDLEAKAEAEALSTPVSAAAAASNPADTQRQKKIAELKDQIEQIDRQIAARENSIKELERKAGEIDRRVDVTPTRESEMIALTRDYQTLQNIYAQTLAKSKEAETSAKLERRQIGEQFRIIDAARVPEKPFTPNRLQINLAGIAGGLALGLALAGLREYRDSTFRTDNDIVTVLSLPVLATIPAIITQEDRVFQRKKRLIVMAASVAVAGICGAALLAWRMNLLQRLL